jgi:hypothetical protein
MPLVEGDVRGEVTLRERVPGRLDIVEPTGGGKFGFGDEGGDNADWVTLGFQSRPDA